MADVAKAPRARKAKSTLPRTSQVVGDAIRTLNERGGSSLRTIKKYVQDKYKVDVKSSAPRIRKYLKSAVGRGILVQLKTGSHGLFKLAPKEPKAKKPKIARKPGSPKKARKPQSPKKAATGGAKKAKSPKKKAVPKPKAAKKTASPAAAGLASPNPKPAKKANSPAKAKSPKPKKATKPKAKKATPKKK